MHKWGVSGELQLLAGGHRNRVLRANDVVFKSTTRSSKAITWLTEIHQCARSAGFLVPELLESEDGNLVESGWTCEQYVRGEQIHACEKAALRPYLASFHSATSSIPQRPGFRSSVELLALPSGGDVDLDAMPRELVKKCRQAWAAVSNRQTAVIHGDLNSANIIKTKDGGIALIDWDECRRDLTLFDLGVVSDDDDGAKRARLAWEIACSWLVEPGRAQNLAHSF